jgi:uncharacterized protein DUF4112
MTTEAVTYSRAQRRARSRRAQGPREISPAVRATVELLDQRFRVPIFGWRFGWDAILGLVPGFGDALGMVLGYGLVFEAIRLKARWRVVGRMSWNLWVNAILGAVPLVGDVFDFLSHPHRKNLELLKSELARE